MMLQTLKRSPALRWIYRLPFLLNAYHFSLAFLGALVYGFPSRKLTAIGVTGTKGKTTTANLIAHLLNSSGRKTGLATTVNFGIGGREWLNETKQTMLGRFALQKLLRQMVQEDSKYAVIETSSEGILQYRHRFINYKVAVFTNLSPEHIERHGSFQGYRAAKVKLFEQVARRRDGIGVYNLDDPNADYFLAPPISRKLGYSLRKKPNADFKVSKVELSADDTGFDLDGAKFTMSLVGKFNVYNAAAALATALALGVSAEDARAALKTARPPAGRMEMVRSPKGFKVVIDYSYEPTGLKNAFDAIKLFNPKRIIVLVGSAGGGRDKWRRPVMGELADKRADMIVVSTDDPYDEDPDAIIEDVFGGVAKSGKKTLGKNVWKIADRGEGIRKALSLARRGDVVLIAGKGGEVWMNVARGKKIPWSDKEIVQEALHT